MKIQAQSSNGHQFSFVFDVFSLSTFITGNTRRSFSNSVLVRKRFPRQYFGTDWTNKTKAAQETTSRPAKNKNLFGTLFKGILFMHFLIESWFEDSLERLYNKTLVNRTVRSYSTRWAYACANDVNSCRTRFYFLNSNCKPKFR